MPRSRPVVCVTKADENMVQVQARTSLTRVGRQEASKLRCMVVVQYGTLHSALLAAVQSIVPETVPALAAFRRIVIVRRKTKLT